MVELSEIFYEIERANKQLSKDRIAEELLIKEWESYQKKIEKFKQLDFDFKKVQALFQIAAEETQKQLEFHINGLVSAALEVLWDEKDGFKAEFVKRRGKTETDLWIMKDGHALDPINGDGGGASDVVAFALRPTFWSLSKDSRPLLILDEPFKNISEDLLPKAVDMLKMLNKKLKLQIIMITHIGELIKCADKKITVALKNGISTIDED